MGLSCKIFRSGDGGVEKVVSPNGEESRLYRNALAAVGGSEDALGLWATAYTSGFKSYYGDWENPSKTDMFNLDENGEPLIYDVLKYYEKENSIFGNFIDSEVNDIRNFLYTSNMSSIHDLVGVIDSYFITPEGISVNETNLRNSGIYTEYEIQRIIGNPSISSEVKNMLDKVYSFYTSDYNERKVDFYTNTSNVGFEVPVDGSFNSLGKQNVYNPGEIDMELRKHIGGLKTQEEMDYAIHGSSNRDLVAKYDNDPVFRNQVFEYYSGLTRIPVYYNGDSASFVSGNTFNGIMYYSKVDDDAADRVRNNILRLESMTNSTWIENIEDVKDSLKSIEKDMSDMGIDVIGISSMRMYPDAVKEYLLSMSSFLSGFRNGDNTLARQFADDTDAILGRSDYSVEDLNERYNGMDVVRIETDKDARTMYYDFGALRVDDGLYVMSNADMTTDEMYDAIAEIAVVNNTVFPALRGMPASYWMTSSVDVMRNNIEKYVKSISDYYNTEDMILHRISLGIGNPKVSVSYDRQTEYGKYTRRSMLSGDANLGEVYGSYLRHKIAGDDLWKNVYQFLRFGTDGRISVYTDHTAAIRSIGTNVSGNERTELQKVLLSYPNTLYEEIFYEDNSYPSMYGFDFRSHMALINSEILRNPSNTVDIGDGNFEAVGVYDEFVNRGGVVYSKISETEKGSVYSVVEENGARNLRKFTEEIHEFSNPGLVSDRSSLIRDVSGIDSSERKSLSSRLECF